MPSAGPLKVFQKTKATFKARAKRPNPDDQRHASQRAPIFYPLRHSREGNPPKDNTHPNKKTVCTNSLRKLFPPAFCLFKEKRADNLYKLLWNCKLCFWFGWVFFWGGWVSPSWDMWFLPRDKRENGHFGRKVADYCDFGPPPPRENNLRKLK